MHKVFSVLLFLAATSMSAIGEAQIHQRQSGAAKPGTIDLIVVDRYALPVQDAAVLLVHRFMGAFSYPSLDALCAISAGQRTDADGRVTISTAEVGLCWALIERTGYAPLLAYPLFPGYRYELQLDLGTSITAWCKAEDGTPAAGAQVELRWRPCSYVPGMGVWPIAGTRPLLRTSTGLFGQVFLEHVPRGQFEIRCSTSDGAAARAHFQVASAFGNEQAPGSDVRLVLRDSPVQSFTIHGETPEAPMNAHGWIAWNSLPILQDGDRVPAIHGRVQFPALDLNHIGSLYFGAPGYNTQRLDVRDPATGRPLQSLPTSIQLSPLESKAVDFSPADVLPGTKDLELFTPVTLGTSDSTGEWTLLSSSSDRCHVDRLPSTIDTFAVAILDQRIVGFLNVDDDGGVHYTQAGILEARYSVGNSAPEAAYIRAYRLESDSKSANPSPGIHENLIELCRPDGTVRFEGLLPGRYRLEPHFHYSVFGDALTEVEVAPGAHVRIEVPVRRGNVIRARVQSPTGEWVLKGRVEIHSTAVPVYRMDSAIELDRTGEALIGGLDPDATYTFHYGALDSEQDAVPWRGSLELAPPHPKEVTIVLTSKGD